MTSAGADPTSGRGTCIDPGCERRVYCRERCQTHYNRDVRNATLALDKSYHDPLPPLKCSAEGCERNIRNDSSGGHRMCGLHYQRWRKYEDVSVDRRTGRRLGRCIATDAGQRCAEDAIARDLCSKHWRRQRKRGDPSIVLKPDLSKRPPSRPRGVEVGSKHWSCGHARRCECADAVGRYSICERVLPKNEYPLASKVYVSTTCRPCLNQRRRDRRANDPEAARRDREASIRSARRTDRVVGRLRARTYEHLRSNLPGRHTVAEAVALFEQYDWTCGYCRERPATDVDHIIPAILHGMEDAQRRLGVGPPTNNIDNFMPACRACNGAKGSRTVHQWRGNEPMVRRGDVEFPPRLHRTMRGPRAETVQLYERILALLDTGLSGVEVARQLAIQKATISAAVRWAGRPHLEKPRQPLRLCSEPGCGRPHKARGLCQAHSVQMRKHRVTRPLAPRAREASSAS